ncbi:MobQ family relaxase [Aerococcus urinaeequi]|uniref:MobQ family relaxase n=1 Tax=Aerococcus urinaeequi TaxID=51665 RepID=UPI003D6BDA6A
MAIYHLSSTTISRGKGQSAIASASYRSGEKLYSERYDQTNYYAREVKPVAFILTPEHAPAYASNRERLWNEVEKVEKRADAQLAREFNVALPVELSHEEQENLVREYVQENFVNRGMVADVAIHRDDENNPHFHFMTTIRPFNPDGSWGKKAEIIYLFDENGEKQRTENGNIRSRKSYTTDWNNKETLNEWRKNWADLANKFLERNGFSDRISEKSNVALGIENEASIHEGYVARQMEKRGEISERCEKNREISARNLARENMKKDITREESKTNIIHILQEDSEENKRMISDSLSPKEKKMLTNVAKNLKIFVTYDKLIDKERMLHNWQNSLKYNAIIHDTEISDKDIQAVADTAENIEQGKAIFEKQSQRIFEKYYPALAEKVNYSAYYVMAITDQTIKQDRVLDDAEIKDVLFNARENHLNEMLKLVVKNPYVQPVEVYFEKLSTSRNQLNMIDEELEIKGISVVDLPEKEQQEYKQLMKTSDLNYKTIRILDSYYSERIQDIYPTVNTDNLKIREKEAIAKAIDYYGGRYSFDKLVGIVQEERIAKFNYLERQQGLEMIEKLSNGDMDSATLEHIQDNPRLAEIYKTVSDPNMRKIFMEEVHTHHKDNQFEATDNLNNDSFAHLVGKVDILASIAEANNDNLRREQQDKAGDYMFKKKKKKKLTKTEQQEAQKRNQPKL